MVADPTSEPPADGASVTPTPKRRWAETLGVYLHRRVVGMLFLGFSAGLPLLLVFGTLSIWVRESGVSLGTIGFTSWVLLAYSLKFLWAPIVDRAPLPILNRLLGRRRSWMLLAQAVIAGGLLGMAFTDPAENLAQMIAFGLTVSFAAATQDIAIDAYRIEAVEKDYQAAMAASYIYGYRAALLVAGGGALFIAEWLSWTAAYAAMAGGMLVGIVTVLVIAEPAAQNSGSVLREQHVMAFMARKAHLPAWLRKASGWVVGAVIMPFADFFARNGWMALVILAFISLYRISDITMGVMANAFYVDLGYTKGNIAEVVKSFGLFMTLIGAGLGGVLVARYGVMRPLLLGAVLVASTNLMFAYMATYHEIDVVPILSQPGVLAGGALDLAFAWMQVRPASVNLLIATISLDNISAGLSTTAFIAYLSSLTNTAYTATQYALFSSLMTLLGKLLAGFSGLVVESVWYASFFAYAAILGVPAVLLVLFLMVRANVDKA